MITLPPFYLSISSGRLKKNDAGVTVKTNPKNNFQGTTIMSIFYITAWGHGPDCGIYRCEIDHRGRVLPVGFNRLRGAGYLAWSIDRRTIYATALADETAGAVAAYFQLVTEANTYLDQAGSAVDADVVAGAAASIAGAFAILGIELPEPEEELPVGLLGVAAGLCAYTGDDVAEAAEQILAARAEARAAKNWDVADAIRDQLRDMGLVIEDTAAGSRIKHA